MSDTNLATTSDIREIKIKLDAIEDSLDSHFLRSFATAHLIIRGQTQSYTDSNQDVVGTHVLEIKAADEVTYYVPCTVVSGDAPSS